LALFATENGVPLPHRESRCRSRWGFAQNACDCLPRFEPLQIGSKSKINATFGVQSATGWSDLRPLSIEMEIVFTEIMSTKVGEI
jgi:hypothetical protein